MASTNAGKFKNLDVEMQKTPVNRGVLSLLNGSKQVQNGLPVTFSTVTSFISEHPAGSLTVSVGSSLRRPFSRPYGKGTASNRVGASEARHPDAQMTMLDSRPCQEAVLRTDGSQESEAR